MKYVHLICCRFDPWNFLFSLRRKAVSLGTEYVNGKVTGLEHHSLDDIITEVTGTSVLQNLNCAEVSHLDNEYCFRVNLVDM